MELPSQQDFRAFLNGRNNELESLYSQIIDQNNIAALANNTPGAQQNDSARKSRVQQLISEMNTYYSQLNQIVEAIERERKSVSEFVKTAKEKLEIIRGEMKERYELATLRKEQAADVKNKYAADYNSSILGLWRPLHPNTQGVLYTASTVLMLIAVATIGYLVTLNKNSPAKTLASVISTKGSGDAPPTSLFDESTNYGKVAGGALKLRAKK
jgi:hypothetical protein